MKSMSIVLLLALIIGVAVGTSLPANAQTVAIGEEHCVINVRADDVLNMRSGPGTGYPTVGGLRYGQCGVIVVAQCQGNWCPIEDGHRAGYVNSHFIGMVSPSRYCVTGVAANDALNLRAYPAATSRILTRLPPNSCGIAFLPYATNGWQKVRVNGWEGWVNRTYLSGQ